MLSQSDLQNIKQRFGIIGNSPLLNRGIEIALQVAKTDLSVLVTGESGVGKEHFPKIIHAFSARKHGPYFAINCGAIPEGTIDSELFGHEKGAFTDAKAERKGYFEIANGGTLFLDEVGELPLQTQVRLLRVLETGEFIRMGASQVQKTNVRVVAATNLNMRHAIEEGRFREDLYYRLNTVEIRVPALRDRKEDIPLLFRKFASDFCNRYQMPSLMLSEEATRLLQSYYWNGNIRQLKNIAEQVSVIEMDHHISADTLQRYLPDNERQSGLVLSSAGSNANAGKDYAHEISLLYNMVVKLQQEISDLKARLHTASSPLAIGTQAPSPASANQVSSPAITASHADTNIGVSLSTHPHSSHSNAEEIQEVEEIENLASSLPYKEAGSQNLEETRRETILRVLAQCNGNRKLAAEKLGISERTLYRKIKEYNL
ncbi:MAG: sigma-54 interaction domain-containing protein [Paludibacteraceae bacterium]